MYRNIDFKITVFSKIILLILFKIALTEGMPYMYYLHQRRVSFILFIFIAFIAGRQNKYFSCLLAFLGVILFNPFYKAKLTGEQWDLAEWILILILLFWLFIDLYKYFVVPKKGRGILNALKFNRKIKKYEVADASVRYEIQSALIKNLRRFMEKSDLGSMQSWYNNLTPEERTKVERIPLHGEV